MLNFKEMYTLLAMIEACLNSRPIIPLSNDPHDLTSLTPEHFLIGTQLTAPAEDNITEVPTNRLSRYQLMMDQQLEHWSSSRKTTLLRFTGPLVESRNYIQRRWQVPCSVGKNSARCV
jgi:hypothetical protein